MAKLLISDTAEATITRKSDGRVFATADSQLASISQTLGINEKIYGQIGNKVIGLMRGQKEVTSTFRSAFYNNEFLSMTQGVAIQEDGTATVYKREDELKVVDNVDILEVTISGTPVGTTVHVINEAGEVVSTAVTTNTATIPTGHASAGDLVSVTYQADVTGDIIALESDKFSEAYKIEYHTIGYDPDKNIVVKDIYIQLDHVVPSGDFELSFENGTAIAPEMTFDCMTAPNSNNIGRIIEVDRVNN